MTSKGVDYTFYVGNLPSGIEVEATDAGASKPKLKVYVNGTGQWATGNVQIGIDGLGLSGEFNWATDTTPVYQGIADINPITGNMTGGNLVDMMKTPSHTDGGTNVSYGFYDAGPGIGDLTNQDQAYCYFTLSQENWMGDLVSWQSQVGGAPFSSFVLPGAHDCGTFDLTAVKDILIAGGAAAAAFLNYLGPGGILGAIIAGLTSAQALTAITNLAVTQKDDITTMLKLGCRYFDFRPGMVPPALQVVADDIYHIHTMIPGYTFSSFLTDVLSWLEANPTEIVVIDANTSGILDDKTMVPSEDKLQAILAGAISGTGSTVVVGDAADLSTTYSDLVSANKRLLFLNQEGSWHPATKYDSYSDKAYATTDPASIVKALEAMNSAGQEDSDYTVLQLQGTATNTGTKVVVSAALSQSSASSPLMSTKADFDSVTYPWAVQNVPFNLEHNQLVVLLNDFVDNVLATTASQLTLARVNQTIMAR